MLPSEADRPEGRPGWPWRLRSAQRDGWGDILFERRGAVIAPPSQGARATRAIDHSRPIGQNTFCATASRNGTPFFETGRGAALALMAGPQRPDDFFCAIDAIAFGTLDALRTTVAQQRARMVDDSVEALPARIENRSRSGLVRVVSGHIVQRATTRPRNGSAATG